MVKTIETVIRDGLRHIAHEQREDGGFTSLSSFCPTDFSDAIPYSTTFFTANILACLNVIAKNKNYRAQTDPIRAKAAAFLLAQKSAAWSFNYWTQDAPEQKTMPFPDDLDDTFGALAALADHDPTLINGAALAAVAHLLIATEEEEGGPYRTWVIARPSAHEARWNDVDLAANSTIGYFLACRGVHLPRVQQLIGNAVQNGTINSPYYPSPAAVFYFISRYYCALGNANHTHDTVTVEQRILMAAVRDFRIQNKARMTPVEQAVTLTALTNLGGPDEMMKGEVQALLKTIARERWKPYAFCLDPARSGAASFAGSSSLTAALCIEALSGYDDEKKNIVNNQKKEVIHRKIITLARQEIKKTPLRPAFRATIMKAINAISDHRITTLAHDFKAAIGAAGAIIGEDAADRLALGNLYGWIAYTIYDDILDDDGGQSLLPVANFFMRSLERIYKKESVKTPECAELFHTTMDTIDAANAWEQRQCGFWGITGETGGALQHIRLPSFHGYGMLADRSIGHAMGPLAELCMAGYGPQTGEFRNVKQLFRHYLIARQLHDDAHDWAEDLMRGRINSVGAMVIKKFGKKYPHPRRRAPHENVPAIIGAFPALREIFWNEVIDDVVALILHHVHAGRGAKNRSALLRSANFMEDDLAALEAGAKNALAGRNDMLLFLARYHHAPA